MDNDLIALVDENDKIIGYENEEEVHKNGTLHQGVTLLLVVQNEWRDQICVHKSEGLWTCSYHTHVKDGEQLKDAAYRIVGEMLHLNIWMWYYGWTTPSMHKIGIFQYCQKSDLCVDNEINHVFLCMLSSEQIGECLNYIPTVFCDGRALGEWSWDEVAWDEEERVMLWPMFPDLEVRMTNNPDTFDASSFTVYECFKYAWIVLNYGMLPCMSDEWDSIKRKKDETLSLRKITAFYIGGSIRLL